MHVTGHVPRGEPQLHAESVRTAAAVAAHCTLCAAAVPRVQCSCGQPFRGCVVRVRTAQARHAVCSVLQGHCAPWSDAALGSVPPSPPLLTPLPGQCLIVVNGTLLQSVSEMWLHNLYIRNVYDRLDSGTLMVRAAPCDDTPGRSSLYMTSITAQGSGNNSAWLYVEQMAYAQGAPPPLRPRRSCRRIACAQARQPCRTAITRPSVPAAVP